MYMARMKWAKNENVKTKLHEVNIEYFVHCEKKKKIFKQCHQNKLSTVLIKTIFYLRRGNTR